MAFVHVYDKEKNNSCLHLTLSKPCLCKTVDEELVAPYIRPDSCCSLSSFLRILDFCRRSEPVWPPGRMIRSYDDSAASPINLSVIILVPWNAVIRKDRSTDETVTSTLALLRTSAIETSSTASDPLATGIRTWI
jgi:hypothetical protein